MPISSWSLDHLFVDQRGILTLVETKLFENPESRREVVGQLIEYAANSIEFWANGIARQKAAEYWSKKNKELDEILQNEFGEIDIESFWASVEENLKNDRIRLIIAADEIRPEVRRMIEYLNREMANAEILGLELKCYGEDESSVVFVPRLVGQTQSNIDRKYTGRSSINYIKWTPEKLKEAYQAYSDNILSEKLQTILNWALDNKYFKLAIALNPIFGLQGKSGTRVVSIFQDGVIYVFLNTKHYPGGPKERDEFVADLKEFNIMDSDLDPEQVTSGRSMQKRLSDLSGEEIERLLQIFTKYCG